MTYESFELISQSRKLNKREGGGGGKGEGVLIRAEGVENFLKKISGKGTLIRDIRSKAFNFIKRETLTQVFSCELCEIFKNTFFNRTPAVAASDETFCEKS